MRNFWNTVDSAGIALCAVAGVAAAITSAVGMFIEVPTLPNLLLWTAVLVSFLTLSRW